MGIPKDFEKGSTDPAANRNGPVISGTLCRAIDRGPATLSTHLKKITRIPSLQLSGRSRRHGAGELRRTLPKGATNFVFRSPGQAMGAMGRRISALTFNHILALLKFSTIEVNMIRALQIPEVVHSICQELDPKGALSMSTACKAFLEPGLDALWALIDSFEPIVLALPKDAWKKETLRFRMSRRTITVVNLNRPLKDADLHRYLTCYAPRIREISITASPGMTMFSLQAWKGLQWAISDGPGTLSPNLKKFAWDNFDLLAEVFDPRPTADIFSYTSLFTGVNTRSVTYTSDRHLALGQPHRRSCEPSQEVLRFQVDVLRLRLWLPWSQLWKDYHPELQGQDGYGKDHGPLPGMPLWRPRPFKGLVQALRL
ncbi:hypothetical protein NMY22_g19564 [Coprinellus aureogranulatus]|nr:hypothetical protein NMY22_g19564 [Coprinellus aureogranulatus]